MNYYINDEMRIIRDISSDVEDIGYERMERRRTFSNGDFEQIDKMKLDYLKVLGQFIDEKGQ